MTMSKPDDLMVSKVIDGVVLVPEWYQSGNVKTSKEFWKVKWKQKKEETEN